MTAPAMDLDALAIDTVRFLAVDMVEAAKSGHPGAPLGLAPVACRIWTRHLRFDPQDPSWPDRDRFVLSCGHASALLYALLHMAGYDLPVGELERFRQLDSKTPGHPEFGHTVGVETTTGPLGQGLANAVGMAMARRHLSARFDREGFPLFAHRIWTLVSDGDLMEGVSAEAASLAGHLGLADLKVVYDDNGISIDGSTDLAMTEEVGARFAAYGWRVLHVGDGNDLAAIDRALESAARESERPTLVVLATHIGYGSPKQDSAEAHGAPLGPEATKATKRALGWPEEARFRVPEEAREPFAAAAARGREEAALWRKRLSLYRSAHEEAAAELERRLGGELPALWRQALPKYAAGAPAIATRAASGAVLKALAPVLPELFGGSADLAESNATHLPGAGTFTARSPEGRYVHFGVREHGMAAIANGLALSGLLRPFAATFLIFSDYCRPSVRLAALSGVPTIFVFTHDSIFLGEDGPTHQPVEQLAALRAIPNLVVLRPADARETVEAWRVALERRSGPTALALTRQKLPVLEGTAERAAEGVERGAYALWESGGEPELVLIATGSEVAPALDAGRALAGEGAAVRVVSAPSLELFAAQEAGYREATLGQRARRLAVEAAAPFGWHRWVGAGGGIVGVERFGASAPAEALAPRYGFTPAAIAERARALLSGAP
jgi:transketolase